MALVWIVEDDVQMQELLEFVLEQAGFVIEKFTDGASVVSESAKRLPDLVVLDIGLPTRDGHQVCEALRADPRSEFLPIIVVTARADTADRYRMFAMGADDFMTKPFDNLELILRIKNRLRRQAASEAPARQDILRVGDVELDLSTHQIRAGVRSGQLTQSEFAILRHLLSRPGRAVDVETLLVEALGYPPRLGNPEILRTHIRNIRQKIEDDTTEPRRLINLPRLGYLISTEPALGKGVLSSDILVPEPSDSPGAAAAS